MNVTCTGCPAKYAVPDEKVRGKKVRITCKHCGTNIVVDGTVFDTVDDAFSKAAAPPQAASSARDSGNASPKAESKLPTQAKPSQAEVTFIVGFPDDRQETHSVSEIVAMYAAGKIDHDTLVWKDGMADWLSPFDVPELAAAFRAKNVAPRASAPNPAFAPVAEEEATLVVRSPLEDPQVAAALAASVPSAPPAAAEHPSPAPEATKPVAEPVIEKPVAARRAEKRGGAVDLFGNLSEAGSEGDVSLDLGPSDDRAQKLTGARNESSVLFSLDALTKPDPKVTQAKAKDRDREASEVLFGESAPDSLMNLGGGVNAMAAPDFTKPVSAVAPAVRLGDSMEVPNEPDKKGRGGVVLLVGFLAIAAAAAVAFVMMKKQAPTAEAPLPSPSSTTQALASAEPAPAVAPAASNMPAASADAAASASSAASATSAAAAGSGSAAPVTSAKPTTAAAPATPSPPSVGAATTPTASPAAAKPADATAAAKPAEAAAPAEGAAFDKNAAVAALSAAAASAASCKTADGPTGSGKVSVTFAPSGRATATSVAGDLAGTEVGGCVARIFRSAKVPPFAGDPVTVSKSFSVQ